MPIDLKEKLIELLKEFEDCSVWDYDEMLKLSRKLVKHRLPIKLGYKPHRQSLIRISKHIELNDKEKI